MNKIAMVAFLSAVSSVVGAAPADTKQAYIDSSFASMDANGDGRVDKAEYAHFQQARFSKQAKDGFLSLAEMQQAMVAAQTADTPR